MFDLRIINGTIVDGTGRKAYRSDIGISGDRIMAIDDLSDAQSAETIDATDLTVTPGFVDIHSHSDQSVTDYPDLDSKLRQGITTEITGNCGHSAAPYDPEWEESSRKFPWTDPESYFAHIERTGLGPNLAMLVGHGNLRLQVIGPSARAATDDDLLKMRSLLERCLTQGCIGLSSGLIYPPGQFADARELASVASVLSSGQMYATHIRNESSLLFEALDEAFETARLSGARLQVSHLKACGKDVWGKIPRALELFESHEALGLDVAFDAYPYPATQTGIRQLFPPWMQDGGRVAFLERLSDPQTRARVTADIDSGDVSWENIYRAAGPENIVIGACKNPEYSGRSIADIARSEGVGAIEAICEIALSENGEAGIITFEMNPNDVETVLKHRLCSVCSDGSGLGATHSEHVHPRNYAAFVHFLSEYVLKRASIGLEEAVRKMTALPASRAGLKSRGSLTPGNYADVVAFDPKKLKANADFSTPIMHATGLRAVLVNGTLAVENDRLTQKRAGRVLKG